MIKVKYGVTVILAFLVTISVYAQPRYKYERNYNTNTVETIEGEVQEVISTPSQKGNYGGIHLKVKTDQEVLEVHLGPAWFIEKQESFNRGDNVEITGSRITFEGKPAIIAATVRKGDMTLNLRNQNGYPVWQAWQKPKMKSKGKTQQIN